jgi:general secretion pathway protein A
MYLHFYGLKEKPFNLTPDSNFLFLSEHHKEALAHIKYGIEEKKGFLLITGEIGSGKTTLCRALLKELEKNHKIALILNSMVSPSGLLKSILIDLGIKTKAKTRQEMMEVLSQTLIEERNIVIVIDEAQNLTMSALEQIRLLGNFETEKEKLVQIILVGQPELRKIIENQRLKQLNQRISVRYHLQPMNREDTTKYINHRLYMAGDTGKITFGEDALQTIYSYSGGVPRIINVICDYCLICGYITESFIIDKNMVDQAIKESQGYFAEEWVITV